MFTMLNIKHPLNKQKKLQQTSYKIVCLWVFQCLYSGKLQRHCRRIELWKYRVEANKKT